MIVCSCNIITREDIRDTVEGFLDEDPWQLITPGRIYRALQQRGQCCGCFPGVIDIIIATSTAYHLKRESPEADVIDFVSRLQAEHKKTLAIKPVLRAPRKRQEKRSA